MCVTPFPLSESREAIMTGLEAVVQHEVSMAKGRLLDLQQRIQDTNALIAQMQRSLQSPNAPRSVVATLRSLESRLQVLEEEFQVFAARKSLDVCSYRMFNQTDKFKLSGFAKALVDFQATFSLTYDALKNGRKQRATISPEVEAATAFDFGYAFSGSVGVVLTLENERLLLGETLLDETIGVVFEMAKATTSEEIAVFAKRIGPPPIRALYKWASDHLTADMGADIEWRKDSARTALLIQKPELYQLREAIAATSDETIQHETYTGTLQGLDVTTKRFRLERPDGEEIVGSTGDVVGPGHSRPVPSTQTVRLELKTKIHYSTEKEDRIWRLLGFVDE